MRRAIIAAVIAGCCCAAPVRAQVSTNPRGSQPEQDNTMTVLVQDVDANQKKFSGMVSGDAKVTVTVEPSAKITAKDGSPKQLTDLKKGSRVKITYSGDKKSPTAMKMEIESG